ncbi:MAG: circularly permuted type 2 ATP-grasp protein [Deltaproteobacteria bacterium]|nr:circularly permuted type 2 ATP-grasp protein [Deltaproteobacteria bacterium]
MEFSKYDCNGFFDELLTQDGQPRDGCALLLEKLQQLEAAEVRRKQETAVTNLTAMGVTFRVYGEETANLERTIPFDILPRVIPGSQWDAIEKGLSQRLRALNLFVDDMYHEQKAISDDVMPRWVLDNAKGFLPQCIGLDPPSGIWSHFCGTDLVRDEHGRFLVLEDNLRVPSGISYVLLNRELTKRNFPEIFQKSNVRQVIDFPTQFKNLMHSLMPHVEDPTLALLTPGIYNAAYFEHSWLALKMGADLVEGRDLVYDGQYLCMRTTRGLRKIDILYRRIDDLYIDPLVFNADSTLGCPGMMKAFRKGNLAIVNTPGTGVADDKVVYRFVPRFIEYYLGEKPILPNVETRMCALKEDLDYTLDNLEKLVVKPAAESGGYGMLVGPKATKDEVEAFRQTLLDNPANYISQPTLKLSTVPTFDESGEIVGRHVDLRPFAIHGAKDVHVIAGGLTRVALKSGSLVVNSSQGGGTKDTWIVDNTDAGGFAPC